MRSRSDNAFTGLMTGLGRLLRAVLNATSSNLEPDQTGRFLSTPSASILGAILWVTLPAVPIKLVPTSIIWYRKEPTVDVTIGTNTCSCERWTEDQRSLVPTCSIGRCCEHLARAWVLELEGIECDPWLIRILKCCSEYAPPARFECRSFTNGVEDFVALYDIRRGYIQLYGPASNPHQWGYDSSKNRWAHGAGPENPLIIKKDLRPWAKAMDIKHGHRPK